MKTEQMEALALVPAKEGALEKRQPTPAEILQAVVERGVTADNAVAVKEIIGLMERMEDRKAETDFAQAFVALQKDLPTFVATTEIHNRGKYLKFEDMMQIVGPLLTRHGFTVAFSMDFKENRILETCHLTHGNHTRSNTFAVRCGKADTETQADCKAATTAKRNALCNALNIVIRQDCLNTEESAAIEGGPITKQQAEELAHRVAMTNSDKAKFLKFAGAASFDKILSGKYPVLDEYLRRKEQQGR